MDCFERSRPLTYICEDMQVCTYTQALNHSYTQALTEIFAKRKFRFLDEFSTTQNINTVVRHRRQRVCCVRAWN